MGWMTGFEPATSGSTIRRSNQLSYTHHTERTLDTGSVAERILAKTEEAPQPGITSQRRASIAMSLLLSAHFHCRQTTVVDGQPLASKAACISVRTAAAAAAGSDASLMGRPTTK